MAEVTIRIPEEMKDVIDDTNDTVYIEAIKEVVRKKLSKTKVRLQEVKRKTAFFEQKHGKAYNEYSSTVPDTVEGHEDWVEWSYFVSLSGELQKKIDKFSILLGND